MTDDRTPARPRGRPAEFDRDTAVRAAMDRIWKSGFEALSISDLADTMSIRRSSFYNSFGDRETVFREALAAYGRVAPDAALAAVAPGQPVGPALRRVFREICRARAADPDGRGCLVVNAVCELVGANAALGGDVAKAVDARVRLFERLLRQAVAQGEIGKPDNVRATARAFIAFVSGLNAVSKVIRDEGELWRMCNDFLVRYGFGSGSTKQQRR